jgi:hypothetical protein
VEREQTQWIAVGETEKPFAVDLLGLDASGIAVEELDRFGGHGSGADHGRRPTASELFFAESTGDGHGCIHSARSDGGELPFPATAR